MRGADARLDEALEVFLAALGDGFPWPEGRPSRCARTTRPMASPATSEAGRPARGPDGDRARRRGTPRAGRRREPLQQTHRKDLIRVERWTSGDLARHPEPRELIRSRRQPGEPRRARHG